MFFTPVIQTTREDGSHKKDDVEKLGTDVGDDGFWTLGILLFWIMRGASKIKEEWVVEEGEEVRRLRHMVLENVYNTLCVWQRQCVFVKQNESVRVWSGRMWQWACIDCMGTSVKSGIGGVLAIQRGNGCTNSKLVWQEQWLGSGRERKGRGQEEGDERVQRDRVVEYNKTCYNICTATEMWRRRPCNRHPIRHIQNRVIVEDFFFTRRP